MRLDSLLKRVVLNSFNFFSIYQFFRELLRKLVIVSIHSACLAERNKTRKTGVNSCSCILPLRVGFYLDQSILRKTC